jgi:hypothetical protein
MCKTSTPIKVPNGQPPAPFKAWHGDMVWESRVHVARH